MSNAFKINQPYTIFIRLPITKTSQGKLFCDPLWAKDLALHLDYIKVFNLCSPIIDSDDIAELEEITDYKINHIYPLKMDYGWLSVFKNLVPNFIAVLKACKETHIAHSDGAGWAFPLSFYLLVIRPFVKFKWVIVIESSFWLINPGEKLTLRKLISHFLHKSLITLSVKSADARIFTQSFYRTLFLGDETDRTMINPASWINSNDVLTTESVIERDALKRKQIVNFFFPSRLIEDKGVRLLFDAVSILALKPLAANITIMGDGPLKDECIAFANTKHSNINVIFKNSVAYGEPFFNLISEYDMVLVTNLKEEQPRIIFDAFSQGVPVLAANTSGIIDIVTANENAVVFEKNNAESLANALESVINNPILPSKLGLNGLAFASGKTHHQMHMARCDFLVKTIH